MISFSCYRCGGPNYDYDWTTMCVSCRAGLHAEQKITKERNFLDRLTAFDITFLTNANILCERDMIKAVCERSF
jgi:hypothetical protein